MNVSDKIAIITGSGRGLGKAIALKLAEFGANIVVCDIDIDGANAVAEEIKTLGNDAIAIKLDVTNKESINNLDKADKSLKGLIDGDPWIKAKDIVLELSA